MIKEHGDEGYQSTVIVHSAREREIIEMYFKFRNVVDFPITFLNKERISGYVANREVLRKKVFEKYSFDPDGKYIGIFGFLSENKGHHIAVDALNFLPSDYKLAIFGAQHPMGIREYDLAEALKHTHMFSQSNNPYISSLIDFVKSFCKQDVKNGEAHNPNNYRVRFLGSLSDEDFIEAMTALDYVVVPYFETGQGGSGNASLALELGCKIVFSRTYAFMDLARYYPDCFEMTDIANSFELAQRIYFWNSDLTPNQKKATAIFNIENNALLHREALENGITGAQRFKTGLMKTD